MTTLMLRRLAALACVVVCSGGVVACGGNDNSSSASASSKPAATPKPSSGAEQLALTATEGGSPPLGFDPKSLSAKAGKVTITLDNPSGNSAPHAIAIEGNGVTGSGAVANPGSKSTLTETLKAGTYTFYCPVGNHRAMGMEGKLTVQ